MGQGGRSSAPFTDKPRRARICKSQQSAQDRTGLASGQHRPAKQTHMLVRNLLSAAYRLPLVYKTLFINFSLIYFYISPQMELRDNFCL